MITGLLQVIKVPSHMLTINENNKYNTVPSHRATIAPGKLDTAQNLSGPPTWKTFIS